jgi:hypothetical protein
MLESQEAKGTNDILKLNSSLSLPLESDAGKYAEKRRDGIYECGH